MISFDRFLLEFDFVSFCQASPGACTELQLLDRDGESVSPHYWLTVGRNWHSDTVLAILQALPGFLCIDCICVITVS